MSFKKGFVICLWALSLIFHHTALAQQAGAGGAQQGLANILGQITPLIQQVRIFCSSGRILNNPLMI